MKTISIAIAILATMSMSVLARPTEYDEELASIPQVSDSWECSDIMCSMYCENGFQQDEFGCDICKCVELEEPECSKKECRMYCESGFKVDDNGCEICECVEPEHKCSEVMCAMYCKNGFQQDEYGCDICTCAEPEESKCPEKECRMHCENGFKVDDIGCPICECEAIDFCAEGCTTYSDGCNTCTCGEDDEAACTLMACEVVEEPKCLD